MPVIIPQQDQKAVNDLRIDLATAMIDLSGTQVADQYSQVKKTGVIASLRNITKQLDLLGICFVHPSGSGPAGRCRDLSKEEHFNG